VRLILRTSRGRKAAVFLFMERGEPVRTHTRWRTGTLEKVWVSNLKVIFTNPTRKLLGAGHQALRGPRRTWGEKTAREIWGRPPTMRKLFWRRPSASRGPPPAAVALGHDGDKIHQDVPDLGPEPLLYPHGPYC